MILNLYFDDANAEIHTDLKSLMRKGNFLDLILVKVHALGAGWNARATLRDTPYTATRMLPPSQKLVAGRRTYRTNKKPVNIWLLDLGIAIDTLITPTLVVGYDDNNIRLRLR